MDCDQEIFSAPWNPTGMPPFSVAELLRRTGAEALAYSFTCMHLPVVRQAWSSA
ncbi:MAG: hypothetical protein ABIG11_01430 [bacterium]